MSWGGSGRWQVRCPAAAGLACSYYITSALTISKELIIPLLTDFNSVSNKMKWRIIDSIINMVEKYNIKKKNDEKVEEKVQKLEDFVKNNF